MCAQCGGGLRDQAAVWVPDTQFSACVLCDAKFSLTRRRHHCRACGKVVCGSCSGNKVGVLGGVGLLGQGVACQARPPTIC